MTWPMVFLFIMVQYGSMIIYFAWKDYYLPDLKAKRAARKNK
jgi:hypothetical protein